MLRHLRSKDTSYLYFIARYPLSTTKTGILPVSIGTSGDRDGDAEEAGELRAGPAGSTIWPLAAALQPGSSLSGHIRLLSPQGKQGHRGTRLIAAALSSPLTGNCSRGGIEKGDMASQNRDTPSIERLALSRTAFLLENI